MAPDGREEPLPLIEVSCIHSGCLSAGFGTTLPASLRNADSAIPTATSRPGVRVLGRWAPPAPPLGGAGLCGPIMSGFLRIGRRRQAMKSGSESDSVRSQRSGCPRPASPGKCCNLPGLSHLLTGRDSLLAATVCCRNIDAGAGRTTTGFPIARVPDPCPAFRALRETERGLKFFFRSLSNIPRPEDTPRA